jgi:hypothetical protein
VGVLFLGDFVQLLLFYDPTAHFVRADLYQQRCSFFAARQRTNQENAPKGICPLETRNAPRQNKFCLIVAQKYKTSDFASAA